MSERQSVSVTAAQRAILLASVGWMRGFYDAPVALLRHPGVPQRHAVRESLWYAAGLLALDDADRDAAAIVDAVLELQFDAPGAVWHGTWPRTPQERPPLSGAVIWRDYDPNWRQFIGCLLGILVRDFAHSLGEARCDRAQAAIGRALAGEPPQRIVPHYSNIALLQAWLLCEYGDRPRGEQFARDIEALYRRDGGFREFNSPTYYGIDLWGLALWRRSSPLAAAGARLEASLWHDVAAFYHPGLRNLCGPYDRAYGMDMTRYASLLGLWLWWGCGEAARAFPDPARAFGHAHDFCAAPLVALAPPAIPAPLQAALTAPVVNRRIERRIAGRQITAQLSGDLMLGAVDPAHADPSGQATPLTAHWLDPAGRVGWLCVRGAPLRGSVAGVSIELRGDGELTLECSAAAPAFAARSWSIDGRVIAATGIDLTPLPASAARVRWALRLPSGEGRLRF